MPTTKKLTVPISHRALWQRVDRKLRQRDELLKAARSERGRQQLGDYFVISSKYGGIVQDHVDIETLARKLGVLKSWEAVR
jgi:hypothetical protein